MTKETDKISVIVPVYNVKNYLESCVQSIMGQTYPDLEILLIDDGSNDGSAEICDRLQGADARIKVYHEKNMKSRGKFLVPFLHFPGFFTVDKNCIFRKFDL